MERLPSFHGGITQVDPRNLKNVDYHRSMSVNDMARKDMSLTQDFNPQLDLANHYLQSFRYERALQCFLRVLQQDPQHQEAMKGVRFIMSKDSFVEQDRYKSIVNRLESVIRDINSNSRSSPQNKVHSPISSIESGFNSKSPDNLLSRRATLRSSMEVRPKRLKDTSKAEKRKLKKSKSPKKSKKNYLPGYVQELLQMQQMLNLKKRVEMFKNPSIEELNSFEKERKVTRESKQQRKIEKRPPAPVLQICELKDCPNPTITNQGTCMSIVCLGRHETTMHTKCWDSYSQEAMEEEGFIRCPLRWCGMQVTKASVDLSRVTSSHEQIQSPVSGGTLNNEPSARSRMSVTSMSSEVSQFTSLRNMIEKKDDEIQQLKGELNDLKLSIKQLPSILSSFEITQSPKQFSRPNSSSSTRSNQESTPVKEDHFKQRKSSDVMEELSNEGVHSPKVISVRVTPRSSISSSTLELQRSFSNGNVPSPYSKQSIFIPERRQSRHSLVNNETVIEVTNDIIANIQSTPSIDSNLETESAIKIQKLYRGYILRKQLKNEQRIYSQVVAEKFFEINDNTNDLVESSEEKTVNWNGNLNQENEIILDDSEHLLETQNLSMDTTSSSTSHSISSEVDLIMSDCKTPLESPRNAFGEDSNSLFTSDRGTSKIDENRSAIVIQRNIRGYFSRKKYKQLNNSSTSFTSIPTMIENNTTHQYEDELASSLNLVSITEVDKNGQSAFVGVDELTKLDEVNGPTIEQGNDHVGVETTDEVAIVKLPLNDELQHKSAILIQKHYRAFVARRLFNDLKEVKKSFSPDKLNISNSEDNLRVVNAIKIQRFYRSYLKNKIENQNVATKQVETSEIVNLNMNNSDEQIINIVDAEQTRESCETHEISNSAAEIRQSELSSLENVTDPEINTGKSIDSGSDIDASNLSNSFPSNEDVNIPNCISEPTIDYDSSIFNESALIIQSAFKQNLALDEDKVQNTQLQGQEIQEGETHSESKADVQSIPIESSAAHLEVAKMDLQELEDITTAKPEPALTTPRENPLVVPKPILIENQEVNLPLITSSNSESALEHELMNANSSISSPNTERLKNEDIQTEVNVEVIQENDTTNPVFEAKTEENVSQESVTQEEFSQESAAAEGNVVEHKPTEIKDESSETTVEVALASESTNDVDTSVVSESTQLAESTLAILEKSTTSGNNIEQLVRIKNRANNLFAHIEFKGDPSKLISSASSSLVIMPQEDSWNQIFLWNGKYFFNVESGMRLHHGNQNAKSPFACMVTPTSELHQKWEYRNGMIVNELDSKGLTISGMNSGSRIDIRPFNLQSPPLDCTWDIIPIVDSKV